MALGSLVPYKRPPDSVETPTSIHALCIALRSMKLLFTASHDLMQSL